MADRFQRITVAKGAATESWTDAELRAMANVTDLDVALATQAWRQDAPASYRGLLQAPQSPRV